MRESPSAIRDSAAPVLKLHLIDYSWIASSWHYLPATRSISSLLR
jgi:hypothetical protein